MNLKIEKSKVESQKSKVEITGSKSETNRLLLLQALYPNLTLENISNSDDSEVMVKALSTICHIERSRDATIINIDHAGTTMRFLTAYFAIQPNSEVVLTGSSRMKERPIKILVDALKQLGAEISYEENDGFPPIRITGKKLLRNKVSLAAKVSSQYISALLLIAPKLENGIELTLLGKITSVPYIKMTLSLLNKIGVETSFIENKISVKPPVSLNAVDGQQFIIESDWSSASYFYSIIALSPVGTQITLSSYKQNSIQGDAALIEIYKNFGVKTIFNDNKSITISKSTSHKSQLTIHHLELNNSPDIAQTIAVTCFGLGIECHLTGLHTLKIKETNRLQALKNELEKLGATVSISDDSLTLGFSTKINSNIKIKTYQDHRMAMAFAPLALKTPIIIEDAEVVSKSYPTFWEDLKVIGFAIKTL
ncbi:3-phosphoshikimate 1-carboxyvinyltransferase [Flavobacterium sp.]|uniref:3-phosphoshikimate 1-carboxyvinyltransferase n=1 Tax=Flavobacterium sp. TaxID=239 RepID=UPI0025CE0DDB|nr:3-phosphoshikimate 1-carboxyvinyltransferase [Flavobacterium sp.]